MLRLILARAFGGFVVLAAVATISFFLLRAAKGGPFDEERNVPPEIQRNIEERYHLRDPLWKQYTHHMAGMLTFDFGHSMKRQQTVNEIIATHFPYSITLGVMSILIAVALGVSAGVVAAWKRNTWTDYAMMTVALLGISIPSFVLGPLLIAGFALHLHLLPPARVEGLSSYILPALALGLIYAGTIARLSRGGMLETLNQDFIRTARAKGLSERAVVLRHALRIGLVPVLTYLGPATAALVSGSFVIEKIFQIPGLGFFFVTTIAERDYPVLTGVLTFYIAFLVLLNLLVDIGYGLLDPRIRDKR